MAISVKVDNPLDDYRLKISNFIKSTRTKIIKNLEPSKTFDISQTSSNTQYRLKNSIKTPLIDYPQDFQEEINNTKKKFYLCLDTVKIDFGGAKNKEIPLIISEVVLNNNYLSTKKDFRLNPLISNFLFQKTSHFTLSNQINEKIRLKTYTIAYILDILNTELGETTHSKKIEISELDYKNLDFFNEILYFQKLDNSKKLISSPFIAASLGIEKSKLYLETLLDQEKGNYYKIPLEQILSFEELKIIKKFKDKRTFRSQVQNPNNLVNSIFEISNLDKIKTLIICKNEESKNKQIDAISNFENTKSSIPKFNEAKSNFERVYFLLNDKENTFQKSILEVLETLILSKNPKIYENQNIEKDIPKIDKDSLFAIFQRWEDYLDLLEKISKLGVFDSNVLSNAWFGSIVQNDEESKKIIEYIENLLNTLIPKIKTFSKDIPKIEKSSTINSLNDYSALLEIYKKLIDILDFFKPEVFEADFDLFIDTLEKNPKGKISFFEKRAIKDESKKYIRFGVQAKNDEDLRNKYIQAKEITSFFKDKIDGFETSMLPENLKEFEEVYLEAIEKINYILSKQPKIENIDSLFNVKFSSLEKVLSDLSKEANSLLKNLDQKQKLFESLKDITPFLEYIYSIMPQTKEKASIEGIKDTFKQYIFKEVYQVLLENNYELSKVSRSFIYSVFENYTKSFTYSNFENNYLSIVSLDEIIAVKNYDYDSIILLDFDTTENLKLWPIFYRTNSLIAINSKNIDFIPELKFENNNLGDTEIDYSTDILIEKIQKDLDRKGVKSQFENKLLKLNSSKYLLIDKPIYNIDDIYKKAKRKGIDNIIFVSILSLFINWDEEIDRIISMI